VKRMMAQTQRHSGCDAGPWWLVFETRNGSITAVLAQRTKPSPACSIRHVII